MTQSTRTEVDRLLATTVTAKHKILELRVQLITANQADRQRLHSEIGKLRSAFVQADTRLQELQQGRAA